MLVCITCNERVGGGNGNTYHSLTTIPTWHQSANHIPLFRHHLLTENRLTSSRPRLVISLNGDQHLVVLRLFSSLLPRRTKTTAGITFQKKKEFKSGPVLTRIEKTEGSKATGDRCPQPPLTSLMSLARMYDLGSAGCIVYLRG